MIPAHLAPRLLIAGGLAVLFSACNDDAAKAKSGDKASAESAPAPGNQEPGKPAEAPAASPLSQAAMDQLMAQCVLVRAAGGKDTSGVVVHTERNPSSGAVRHLIAASTSPESEGLRLAYRSANGRVATSTATRETILPNGLALYSTTAKGPFTATKSAPAEAAVHACRLGGSGSIDEKERAALEAKIEPLKKQFNDLNLRNRDAMRNQGMDRAAREEAMRQNREIAMERSRLSSEISQLSARLEMPLDSISGEVIASGASVDALEKSPAALEGTVLVNDEGTVTAIRHEGKWISTTDLMPANAGTPASINLKVSGDQNSVHVSCDIEWATTFGNPPCSMVAATTFELESIQGADVAERLSKVEAQKMNSSKTKSSANDNCEWNGKPTSLWIRIFKDSDPAHPIIDEMVQLDYPGQFLAKWAKPPSPLIAHQASQPNKPDNLLRETRVATAQGTILDLVAAGDGSVLIVRTDRAPYLAPFDLKAGRFEEAPWKAGPDTLVATQAGKVYLIDRKSKVLEIWDLASKKRTGLQLLAIDGDLVAAAAPLSSPTSPLLVASDKTARFFDPVRFDPIASGLAVDECFTDEKSRDYRLPQVVPSSVHLRASGDGALYALHGDPPGSQRSNRVTLPIQVDSSSLAVTLNSGSGFLATRGRVMTQQGYPDHGGSEISLRVERSRMPFPSPPGMIQFMDSKTRKSLAELWNLPVAPSESSKSASPLPPDRTIYFDSTHDVVLAPDGDKLHVLFLNLPKQPPAEAEFAFAGEELLIPLPPGRDHKLIITHDQNNAGETVIEGNFAKWPIPESYSSSTANLTLEWTAELGSTMTRNYQYPIAKPSPRPFVESPDGKSKIPLRRTGVLTAPGDIRGFAASGEILLTRADKRYAAWNLSTCERLLELEEEGRTIFGDADQLYVLKDNDTLKSFDLRTGAPLKEVSYGDTSQREDGLSGITTGISARGPLIAVEKDGMNRYLALIDRKTLESRLLNFARDTQQLFFIPQFTANPSGSTIWSFNAGVFWENDNKISVTSFTNNPMHGTPDASGRFIVGSDGILDFKATPPVRTQTREIPGGGGSVACSLDVSGDYLLLTDSSSRPGTAVISVRQVAKPGDEIFKLVVPADHHQSARVISGVHKLIAPLSDQSQYRVGIYHFDIPALTAELAAGAGNP